MAYQGYEFYIDGLRLPFAPPSIKMSIGANNETATLLNNTEINILKNPKLTEISFEARIPQQQFPYAHDLVSATTYLDKFESLILNKKVFKLVVCRTVGRKKVFSTVMNVTLENYDITEDAEEGFDLLVELEFKKYESFGTKLLRNSTQAPNVTSGNKGGTVKPSTVTLPRQYKIQKGDSLWTIARAYYGDSEKYKKIYTTNKTVIEKAAKANGRSSSSNGYYIYPGTVITIPKL